MRSSDDVTKGGCWPAPARPALFLGYGSSVLTTRQKQKRCVCVFASLVLFYKFFIFSRKKTKDIMVWQSVGSGEWNATFHSVSEQVEKQQACALSVLVGVFFVVFWEERPGAGFCFGRTGGACMQLPCQPPHLPEICCSQEVGGVGIGRSLYKRAATRWFLLAVSRRLALRPGQHRFF